MKNKIEEIFGPKCDTYEEDCPTCVVYKALEEERQKRDGIVKAERERANKIVTEELDNTSNIYGWHKDKCGGHLHDIQCPVVALRRKIEKRLLTNH